MFASNHRRLAYNEQRGPIASLHATWQPDSRTQPITIPCHVGGKWAELDQAESKHVAFEGATVATPKTPLVVCCRPSFPECCPMLPEWCLMFPE